MNRLKIHPMEKQKHFGCRLSAFIKRTTQVSNTVPDLQNEVQGSYTPFDCENSHNYPMVKEDSLLSKRIRTADTITTPAVASDSVVVPSVPTSTSTPSYFVTSVFKAAEVGNIEILRNQLKSGTSANQRNKKGFTLLHLAVSGGQEKAAKLLLDAGASANAICPFSRTSIHIAAEKGLVDIVQMLLDAGADTNAKDPDNVTPLMLAANGGHADVVKLLIDKGASLNVYNREANTALLIAVKQGYSGVAKLLIDKGASVDASDGEAKTPLWCAVERRENDLVKYLCDRGASVDIKKSPLIAASQTGNLEAITLMLQNKDPLRFNDISYALSVAKDVRVLLAFDDAMPGIIRGYEAQVAITMAAREGRVYSLKALLDVGVDVNSRGISNKIALHCARENNHTECIELLLKLGAI